MCPALRQVSKLHHVASSIATHARRSKTLAKNGRRETGKTAIDRWADAPSFSIRENLLSRERKIFPPTAIMFPHLYDPRSINHLSRSIESSKKTRSNRSIVGCDAIIIVGVREYVVFSRPSPVSRQIL